jgi:hypothetical protein
MAKKTNDQPKGKLGTGERFKHLESELENKGATDAAALAAWIGRKKYGNKEFAHLSEAGKKKGK